MSAWDRPAQVEHLFYLSTVPMAYAELHCHSNFSFLDGASAPGRAGRARRRAGPGRPRRHRPPGPLRRRPVRVRRGGRRHPPGHRRRGRAARCDRPGPGRRRRSRRGARVDAVAAASAPDPGAMAVEGRAGSAPAGAGPAARPSRRGQGGSLAASATRQRGAHLVLLARERDRLAEPVPADLAGEPRRDEGRAAVPRRPRSPSTPRGSWRSSGCREGEIARRLRVGDRAGARAAAARTRRSRSGIAGPASTSSCRTTCCPTTTGSSRSPSRWPRELRLPVVVTNDVHYARPEGRELQDVLAAIRHGRTLDGARRPAPPRRRVIPQVRGGGAGAAAGHRRAGPRAWRGPGRGDRRRRRSWRRRARSTSGSSSTASRASRCPRARRRSRTSPRCAGTAPGGATTR